MHALPSCAPTDRFRYFARGTFTLPGLQRETQAYTGAISLMVDDGVVLAVNGQEVYRINVGDSGYTVYVALRVTGSRQSFLFTATADINEHTVAHAAARPSSSNPMQKEVLRCRKSIFSLIDCPDPDPDPDPDCPGTPRAS